MDIRKVKKLIELIEESGIAEIEIKEGEESVRISRGPIATYAVTAPPIAAPIATPPSPIESAALEPAMPVEAVHVIAAPMVGTFYNAPSPESEPFVRIGQLVSEGDTLCIIEAMKIMNPIESDRTGTITAVLVENGYPVEYEQPLFVID
ncbi:MAG: acetyl-CoA carboxylase biotin carboxyl carrier protein [Proteobacteria bacterium]|nr:acetyl-CoA carboxylase biotin carboxyl carrier protein [Pseudomonadota bacterium]